MTNQIIVENKIKDFNKSITVSGDKSLSIRWVLFSSIATGKSKAYNLLLSDDVLAAINAVKKLGAKVKLSNDYCTIIGNGPSGYKYKKNITINSENSGTLGRLIMGLLIDTPHKIKIIGDKSLSKRDFYRIAEPLKKFGAKIKLTKKGLPLTIQGKENPLSIKYLENKGSAQCKSSVMLAALNTKGETYIKAKKSRDHTEILFKYLKIPILVKKKKTFDIIRIKGGYQFNGFNYHIPSDISSSAFFIVLTLLAKKSKLTIKNVNINPSRIGIVTILKKMGAKISFKNKKVINGEKVADILVKSTKKVNPIKCPKNLNSQAIDEFLLIFLVAAKANGVSTFSDLSELNQKESPRLILGSKILNMMGIKTKLTNSSIKIYGKPDVKIKNIIKIKDYLKDHRIFMMSMVSALTVGGHWKLYDPDSIKTSFPSFLELINNLRN